MKKGFTLVELTAVVVLISLIFLISYSVISNSINAKKEEISDTMNKIIYEAANIYIGYNPSNYSMVDGNLYCIKLNDLVEYELLSNPLLDPITNKEISLNKYVKLEVNVDEYQYSIVDSCNEKR